MRINKVIVILLIIPLNTYSASIEGMGCLGVSAKDCYPSKLNEKTKQKIITVTATSLSFAHSEKGQSLRHYGRPFVKRFTSDRYTVDPIPRYIRAQKD